MKKELLLSSLLALQPTLGIQHHVFALDVPQVEETKRPLTLDLLSEKIYQGMFHSYDLEQGKVVTIQRSYKLKIQFLPLCSQYPRLEDCSKEDPILVTPDSIPSSRLLEYEVRVQKIDIKNNEIIIENKDQSYFAQSLSKENPNQIKLYDCGSTQNCNEEGPFVTFEINDRSPKVNLRSIENKDFTAFQIEGVFKNIKGRRTR